MYSVGVLVCWRRSQKPLSAVCPEEAFQLCGRTGSHVRLECWPPQDLKPKLPHHAPNHVRERTERMSGERASLLGRYNLIQSHCGKVPESRALVGEPHVASLLCVTSLCDVSEQSIGASGHWYTGNRSHEVKRLLRAMRQPP